MNVIKKNWFLIGLISITLITLLDTHGVFVTPGLWVKDHGGPNIVIILIFFLSGLALNTQQLQDGVSDMPGTLLALVLIFLVSPLLSLVFFILPIPSGILLGLLLVAVMPSTLSSGVVMTGAAGGNMAHALLVTILANSLAVVSIPLILGPLLNLAGIDRVIAIARLPIMMKILFLVLLPLITGLATRRLYQTKLELFLPVTSIINQLAILFIVWTALCGGREAIFSRLSSLAIIVAVVAAFHAALVSCGFLLTKLFSLPKGRRESVILMGGQKTLPLSVILQVSLFPEYGLALALCVAHHIVHLIMDAFLIKYLHTKA
jgi:sodium/bile acid cotransporter 7